jgi:HSP20 family protein
MKNLILRNPFEKSFGFYLDRFFDNEDWFRGFPITKQNGQVNVVEENDGYKIEISAPGFTRDELNINLEDGVLTINGEHKEEKDNSEKNYTRKEFSKQSFSRSFSIPEDINDNGFDAKFENGVLTLSCKKQEQLPKPDPKRIEIK